MNTHAQTNDHSEEVLFHPLTDYIIEHHDQKSWAVTDDGLICAPVGFYRIMNLYEETPAHSAESLKVLVFGFRPEDLDLETHPDYPELKILKQTAYILPPIDTDYADGWAETAIRGHQAEWLKYTRGFGNLYPTQRGNDYYLSNNLAKYHITPHYDEKGSIISYDVRLRMNPFSRRYAWGEDIEKDFEQNIKPKQRGIVLKKNISTLDDAISFIHHDYRGRDQSFVKGEEVQRWADPDKLHGVSMWLENRFTDIKGKPLTVGSTASKLLEFIVTKWNPAAIILGLGMEALGERAMEEGHPNAFHEIAEVFEHSIVPISAMKDEVRMRCVAVPADEVRSALITDFPLCADLAEYRRLRALDVIHNVEPSIILFDEGNSTITARALNGLEVHRITEGHCQNKTRLHVTYSPNHAASSLPSHCDGLFEKGRIADIRIMPREESCPANDDECHPVSYNPDARVHVGFSPLAEVFEKVRHIPLIVGALNRHRHPEFANAAAELTDIKPQKLSLLDQFKSYGQTLLYYGRLLSPFVDAKDPEGWRRSAAALTVAILANQDVFGRVFEMAAPWAFALSAAMMTRRMAANALTPRVKKYLNVVTQAFFAAGPILFARELGMEMSRDYSEAGQFHFNQENAENVGGFVTACFATYSYSKATLKALRRAGLDKIRARSGYKREKEAPAPN